MKRARSWRRYLRLGGSVREEVDDEVAFHLDEQTRALMESGMGEEAASAAALGMFGNRQRIERALLEIGHARAREERRSAMLKDLHALRRGRAAGAVLHDPARAYPRAAGCAQRRRHQRAAAERRRCDRRLTIAGREFAPGEMPTAKKRVVTTGYFETLGIPVLRGRVFEEQDRAGTREVVVISQTLARRYWPDADPVGQIMSFSWGPGDEQEIIGVVGDVRHDGLDAGVEGMLYRAISQFGFPGLTLVVRTQGEPSALIDAVRAQVRSLDPTLPIDAVMTLRDLVRASVSARSTLMVLLTGFAAIALLLAAVGVYAITAQSVGQRTREIGVRKALGAQNGDVLRLVIGEEALVLGVGLALGVAGALAAVPVLASSLYGIEARDPITLAGAAALLAGVGLLAAWLPARRASRLDPVRALRV